MLRPVKKGKPGELIHVTNSPRFHAHANLAVDDQDRLWVAYDEAAENWGKDFGLLFEGGTCLYAGRRLRFAILDNGKWLEPRDDLNKRIMPEDQGFAATGQLCADGKGRMWVVFRPRTENETHMTWFGQGNKWELLASYYSGERWSDPVKLPESLSYNEGPFDTAADPDGRIWLAWMTDRRFWQFSALPRHNDILAASLIAHSQAPMSLGPRSTEPPGKGPADRDEQANLARIRDYSIRSGTKTYKIYRGDLHRHTDLSGDGAGDGSVWDFYRYMLDAANMDFGAITDHRGHPTYDLEYPWWRIEKSEDMFHIPDFYVSLFGYERSAPPPQGHRNLFFDHRGVPVLSFQDQEAFFAPDSGDRWEHPEARRDGKISSGAFLYPYLIEHGGIAIPHHTASTNMGTDWRDNDPRLEPVVEIFQGSRISYEHTKAPLNPFGKRSDYQFQEVQGFMPWGTVWRAWSKGFKLGVIASSDHISTHCSYACVFSDDYSRRGLIEAMRKRHTYGATDNIIMDVRLQDGDDEYLMGDELTTSRIPQLSVKLIGTGAIHKVDVFRRTQLIHSRPGQGPDIEFTLREESLDAGKHYYYVRMEQVDGNVAWASPIWVEYRP